METEKKIRIEKLTKELNGYARSYYENGISQVSDYEYDRLYRELTDLENETGYSLPDSPTKRVGNYINSKFNQVTHSTKRLSIDDYFDESEINDFANKMKKFDPNVTFSCEHKIDGLNLALIYKDGVLVLASTRGNGSVGDDITENVKRVGSVPLSLPEKLDIEVRGELYMSKASFEKMNKKLEENGEDKMSNPRNAAVGTIKSKEARVVAERGLDTFIYELVEPEKYGIKTQKEALEYMSRLGFVVNKASIVAETVDGVMNFISYWADKKNDLAYPIDGIVVKVNEVSLYKTIGCTEKCPRYYAAYKYPAEEAITLLKEITYQVGRTGVITPVANFETVHISGTDVSKATLHNEDYIKSRDIRVGDYVYVRKSGEIIPECFKVDLSKRRPDVKPFVMINECPCCGSPLSRKDGEADWFCLNPDCDAKILNNLIHFASKPAMYIEGMGEKVIETLYNLGYVKTVDDFYRLSDHRDDLIKLDRMGENSVDKLLASIEISKGQNMDRVLFALGIKGIGAKVALLLCKRFPSFDALKNAKREEIVEIDTLGETVADAIVNWFAVEKNVKLVDTLISLGLTSTFKEKNTFDGAFAHKIVVITGSFEKYSRDELSELVETQGGTVTGSVSKKTDILLCGDKAGSKLAKAQSLGIRIINEDELNSII